MAQVNGHVIRDGGSTGSTDSKLLSRSQENNNLLLLGAIAMGCVVLTSQIVFAKNLPKESGFYAVIACTGSVGVTFALLVVFDVLRSLSADLPASVKPSVFVVLFGFYVTFIMCVVTLSSHHYFLAPLIYVLVASSIIVHFTIFKISNTRSSRIATK